jgi:hypothetical protein
MNDRAGQVGGHQLIGAPRVDRTSPPAPSIDPLRYCVMTTVALLAWATGPWMVLVMAAIGLLAYGRAMRGGLTQSRCVLRYPWLVMTYLGLALLGAAAALLPALRTS